MSEVDELVAQQTRDDSTHQDPERFAGVRTVPFEKFVERGRDFPDDDIVVRDGTPSTDEAAAKALGKFHANRVHPIHRPRTARDAEALELGLKPHIDELQFDKADAVRLVFFGWFSYRTTARMLGLQSPSTVHLRLRGRDWVGKPHTPGALDILRERIEAATGSEGMEFPPTRPFDGSDRCSDQESDWCSHPTCTTFRCDAHYRAPFCDGHFEDATCDADGCVTILPRHYNPHTSCRVHSTGRTTRHDFNLDWLVRVGLVAMGGHTRPERPSGSAAVLPSAVAS